MYYGSIRISTSPSGADVSIGGGKREGGEKGITPIDIINVYPGVYNVTLKYPDLRTYNFNVTVKDGIMTDVHFDFIIQEVSEEYISLTGEDLVVIPEEDKKDEEENIEKQIVSPVEQRIDSIFKPILNNLNNSLDGIKSLLQKLLENSDKQVEKNLTGKFDTGIQTLANAVTFIPPEDDVSDTGVNGYTRVAVWDILERLSQTIYALNQGPGTIFVRKSNDGKTFSAVEIPVFAGERHTFNDVYEFRIRTDLAGTRYRITEYETALIINNFDDRVATPAHIFFGLDSFGPHGATVRASYTVPTGFKAKINGCYIFIEIGGAAAVPGRRTLTISINSPTIGGLSVMSRSFGANENTLGTVKEAELGFAYTLLTGESVRLTTEDNSTGGFVNYFGSVEITQYFSYPT